MTASELQDKTATVVGGARSGRAVAKLLAGAGAEVFVTEHGPPADGLEATLDDAGIAYEFNGHTRRALDADLMVLSPGVPSQANIVQQARRNQLPIYSEIETASWFCEAPIVAITGTNGKTTTTSLTGHIFRSAFDETTDRRVIVAGNIGYPFSDYVQDARPQDVVVLEVSSFQLDHVDAFRPRIGAILNITPDHLDRYDHDFNAYAQAKFNLLQNQAGDDVAIYNHDDAFVRDYVTRQAAKRGFHAAGVSLSETLARGGFLRDDKLVVRLGDAEESVIPREDLALRGQHNLYNSLTAAVAARLMDVDTDAIREGLASFGGVPHRLETVRTVNDVLYVNDSKATNVNAVWYAIDSFDEPVVLIAGGRDKGNDYSDLRRLVRDRVRAVVALGESADKVVRELGPEVRQHATAGSMEEALTTARTLACPGDVVLLSPACSSFDMYDDYEHRGDTFRRLVHNL
jgi:UDP-N-acetylmuramoylalanine--D-glutamate ligase